MTIDDALELRFGSHAQRLEYKDALVANVLGVHLSEALTMREANDKAYLYAFHSLSQLNPNLLNIMVIEETADH